MIDIDPDQTVFDLTVAHPELIDLLVALGFLGVKNPATRRTVGRTITLRKGCRIQRKSLDEVAAALEAAGFRLVEIGPAGDPPPAD